MPADAKLKKLLIKALGIFKYLLNLKPGLYVQEIANMARLEIEIDITNPGRRAPLQQFDLQSDFERDRGISHAPHRRQEGQDSGTWLVISGDIFTCWPFGALSVDDFWNFLQ